MVQQRVQVSSEILQAMFAGKWGSGVSIIPNLPSDAVVVDAKMVLPGLVELCFESPSWKDVNDPLTKPQ